MVKALGTCADCLVNSAATRWPPAHHPAPAFPIFQQTFLRQARALLTDEQLRRAFISMPSPLADCISISSTITTASSLSASAIPSLSPRTQSPRGRDPHPQGKTLPLHGSRKRTGRP